MDNIDTFNDLRQAIVDKIQSEETTIEVAYFAQRSEFEGSPAAVVNVYGNESLYSSTMTDKMTFVFQILIYIPITAESDRDAAERRMGKAYWDVLRMFNKRGCLAGHADFVEPLPSSWGMEERDAGVYLFSQINLRCVVYVSNQPNVGS